MNRLLLLLVLVAGLYCKKSRTAGSGNDLVEIYALKSFQLVPQKCQVDPATAVLQDVPVISNDEILTYSRGNHLFSLTDGGKQDTEQFNTYHAFAVTVNKEVIYYGFYKPFTSSSSCDHSITMYISFPSRTLVMNLGYPSPMPGIAIDDQRNNATLLAALNAQGKLRF